MLLIFEKPLMPLYQKSHKKAKIKIKAVLYG